MPAAVTSVFFFDSRNNSTRSFVLISVSVDRPAALPGELGFEVLLGRGRPKDMGVERRRCHDRFVPSGKRNIYIRNEHRGKNKDSFGVDLR